MALEIYNLSNTKEYIGSIKSLNLIETELDLFQKKTGLTIDSYGTTRLYLDHIKLLVELMESNKNELRNIKSILMNAIENEHGLLIEGD